MVINGVVKAGKKVQIEISNRQNRRVHRIELFEIGHLRSPHRVHAHPHRFLRGERGNASGTAGRGFEERCEAGRVGGAEGDEVDALENAMDAAEDDEAVEVDRLVQLLEDGTLQNVQNAHVLVEQRQQRLQVIDRLFVLF